MRKKSFLSFLFFCQIFSSTILSQQLLQIYNENGVESDFAEMVQKAASADILFVGELHNNPVCHWASYTLLEKLYALDSQHIKLGFEMFEADQQHLFNELANGIFDVSSLSKYTRTWNNYKTDYHPMVAFAAAENIPIIATNIPRQYASYVYHNGLDALYDHSIHPDWLPERGFGIDTNLVTYRSLLDMAKQMGMGHESGYFLEAQAIKDATMAKRMLDNYKAEDLFYHLNGSYHSENKEGIMWYIAQQRPDLDLINIQCMESDNPAVLEGIENKKADFYILIDSNLSKSYE